MSRQEFNVLTSTAPQRKYLDSLLFKCPNVIDDEWLVPPPSAPAAGGAARLLPLTAKFLLKRDGDPQSILSDFRRFHTFASYLTHPQGEKEVPCTPLEMLSTHSNRWVTEVSDEARRAKRVARWIVMASRKREFDMEPTDYNVQLKSHAPPRYQPLRRICPLSTFAPALTLLQCWVCTLTWLATGGE
jgi:hypothetical protein